jgi:hypothetical protein
VRKTTVIYDGVGCVKQQFEDTTDFRKTLTVDAGFSPGEGSAGKALMASTCSD